ncbi:MAG: hypothetical protein KBC16_00560 [Candidatus Pacebacteria bacterium]|nr:hypothetical protein [Candidatus Paceibacterota bacterium]
MGTWTGSWTFRNVMHHLHNSTGTKTVTASSEQGAKSKIKDEASRELFGTTGMHTYIDVSNLREGNGRRW